MRLENGGTGGTRYVKRPGSGSTWSTWSTRAPAADNDWPRTGPRSRGLQQLVDQITGVCVCAGVCVSALMRRAAQQLADQVARDAGGNRAGSR